MYCNDSCASEGMYDAASGVLFCDSCGLPALRQVRVRLEKSIKRHDNGEVLAGYTRLYTATWDAGR